MKKTQVESLLQVFATKNEDKKTITNRCVIYTRVSSKDQMNNLSIDVQRKYCLAFAEKKGYHVVAEFGGTYESAKSDKDRKEFQRMLSFVKKKSNEISWIVTYSYDRFSRTGSKASMLTEELAERGINVISATQEIDPLNQSAGFQKDLFLLFSSFDNKLRADRSITGMRELLLKGYWVFATPIGYTALNKGESSDKRNIVINDEGRLIKKAFNLKAAGRRTVDISAYLAKKGLIIGKRKLYKIFKNPFYAGYITSRMLEGKVLKGQHEALVSPELFLQVNNISAKDKRGKRRTGYHESLWLQNLMICSGCNLTVTGYRKVKPSGKQYHYYKCRNSCKQNVRDEIMNNNFMTFLSKYQVKKECIQPIKEYLQALYEEIFAERVREEKLRKQKLGELNGKLERIDERFAIGEISSELHQKFKAKYETEKTALLPENPEVQNFSSNSAKYIEKALEISSKLLKFWELASTEQRRSFISLAFSEGIFYDWNSGLVRTPKVMHIFEVARCFSEGNENKNAGKQNLLSGECHLVGFEGFEPPTPSV